MMLSATAPGAASGVSVPVSTDSTSWPMRLPSGCSRRRVWGSCPRSPAWPTTGPESSSWSSIPSTAPPTRRARSRGTPPASVPSMRMGRERRWWSTSRRARGSPRSGARAQRVTECRSRPAGVTSVDGALVVLNGHPSEHLGWKQYRALGATALDLCAVAAGMVDGTIDCTTDALGPWDYLGALVDPVRGGRSHGRCGGPAVGGDGTRCPPHPGVGRNQRAVRVAPRRATAVVARLTPSA